MVGARASWNRRRLKRALDPGAVPAAWIQPGVLDPEGAKLEHLFWCQGVGALKVLQTPELYDGMFPGYEAARGDSALWSRYFAERFEQTVYSPALMRATADRSLRVSASSFGSLDLYRKYGGDIILFGVSDTFIPVSTGLLRENLDELGRPQARGKRILLFARGNLTPEEVAWLARGIHGRPRKSALAVWGFSLTMARRQPLADMLRRDFFNLYRNWRAENNIARFDRRFPHPTWDVLLGAVSGAGAEGPRIPDAVAADARTLDAFLDSGDPARYAIDPDEADCDVTALSRGVDEALGELLKVADKVLLYVPPTAAAGRRGTAACLAPSVTAMLLTKAGPRVEVETSGWRSYGLTSRDYLYPAAEKGFWTLDPLHANASGARKITRVLARRVAEALTP